MRDLFFSSSACELQTSDAGVCLPGDGGAYCTVEVVPDGFYHLSRTALSSLGLFPPLFLALCLAAGERESCIYFVGGQNFLVLGNSNLTNFQLAV